MMRSIYIIIVLIMLTSQGLISGELKLTHPNGGEVFEFGTETAIRWKGISDTAKVKLTFSADNGATWSTIADSAKGLKFDWKVPIVESDSCLVQISHEEYSKYNEGDLIWEKNYGGSGSEEAKSIIETIDGGYLISGSSSSDNYDISGNKGDSDYIVIKTDSNGIIEWSKTYGGSNTDVAISAIQFSDGGYLIAGVSSSSDYDVSFNHGNDDIWLLKLNINGDIQWEKSIGGSDKEELTSIQYTEDNGFILVGSTYSNDGDISTQKKGFDNDIWIVKTDSLGNIEWEKRIGKENDDTGNDIQSIDRQSFIVLTTITLYLYQHPNSKIKLLKINQDGTIIWEKEYGGSSQDIGNKVKLTSDGGFIFCGRSFSKDGDISKPSDENNLWVVKIDSLGNIEWDNNLSAQIPTGIIQLYDGSYIITTEGNSYFTLFKLNKNGLLEDSKYFGSPNTDAAYSLIETSNRDILLAGIIRGVGRDVKKYYGKDDIWVIKVAGSPPLQTVSSNKVFSIVETISSVINSDKLGLRVLTNFANSSANIKFNLTESGVTTLELFDNLGNKVETLLSGYENIGSQEINLELSNYASGRYYIKLTTPTITKTEIIEVVR